MIVGIRYRILTWASQVAYAMLQSPLPEKVVSPAGTAQGITPYQKQYDFSNDWFTHNIPIWQEVLKPYRGEPNVSYLEVGAYEGGSVIWMLENILTDPTAKLTAIDIFSGPYKDKYFKNIDHSGYSDKVTTITNYSQLALRSLPLNSFDIIYIDGSHAKQDVLEDAVLSWRLLKSGGLLIFDDYRWAGCFGERNTTDPTDCPKVAIDPFFQCFESHFQVVHNGNQLILRKDGDGS
jgi:SAM-dependent methyltransferase